MSNVPELLNGFQIKSYYRYLLYVAGVIFILSFFLDVKGVETSELRANSFAVIAGGCIIWFINDIFATWAEGRRLGIENNDSYAWDRHWEFERSLYWWFVVIQVIAWVIVLLVVV